MIAKTVAGFELRPGALPLVALHTFDASASGELLHFINGALRATVPPEGWKDYAISYPEAQDIIGQLTIKPEPVAMTPDDSLAAHYKKVFPAAE